MISSVERDADDQFRVELVRLGADADRDDRLAEADDHEQAVALGEVLDRDALQPAQRSRVNHAGPGVVDRRRRVQNATRQPPCQERAGDQQRHADQ